MAPVKMPAADSPFRDRIGPYRIIARVGAGGMGEVFKAWDPRLEREVAIKLLHADVAGDAVRQKRLLAEGRAASALNHPNILRVYDADVDGDSYYLVSEWLEGKSLRDELGRGSMSIRRLLDLAVQIADGLAAAHAIGIVHRDIKPENIMLARDGTARIVDFGLARSDPHAPATVHHATHAATVSLEGGLSGTPAYMSPEQARGGAGDFRTDQFAFGALMYEMATGQSPFRRDTLADTLAAVLNDEPKPVTAVNPRMPAPVAWIVEQCLAKDPAERYAATEDLARELRRVRERLRETALEPPPEQARRPPRRAAAVIAAGVAGAVAALWLVGVPADAPQLRFTPIASAAAYEGMPIWSPDAQSLAWVADVDGVLQVFVRRLSDAVATQVTRGRFDAEEPFWAPDSRTLYFISAAGEGTGLWTIGSAGGRPELLIENVNHAAIDPSGSKFALMRTNDYLYQRLWWASADGGDLVEEKRGRFGEEGFGLGGQLQFRPDGRYVLVWAFNARQASRDASSAYYLLPTDATAPVREVLTTVPSTANLQPVSWFPDNRHVVVGISNPSGGTRHLWLGDIESTALRQLTSTHTSETWPAVSPSGRQIAYASEEVDFDLITIAEDGRSQRPLLATARNEMDPAWAPAGDQYAFVTDRVGPSEIWVRSRDGQWERPLVTGAMFESQTDTLGSLAYSPDGRTLAFQRRDRGRATIWLVATTGGNAVQLISRDEAWGYDDAPTWSPDGEWIAYTQSVGANFSLAKRRMGTDRVTMLIDSVAPFSRAAWSPDGQWIATETIQGVVVIPADGGVPEVVLAETPLAFSWTPDSRRIVALAEAESVGHIAMIEVDRTTREARLLNPDIGTIPLANQPIRGFSYAKGVGFLTSFARARSDIWLLDGFATPGRRLLSWFWR
jgi:Tol biopolymer transport system component